MQGSSSLFLPVILLLSAVVLVPISKRLGLGTVLGYLMAGLLIGPWGLRVVTNIEDIRHFSEFGVVLFLFLIGLELDPKKLWALRVQIFGLGTLQVFVNSLLIAGAIRLLGFSWPVSALAGMGFSLSSTAIGLQILKEKNLVTNRAGEAAFSILLFQDIAVIPMMAILPLLFVVNSAEGSGGHSMGFFKVMGVLLAVIALGRLFLRPVLRSIAATHLREIFTALALLLVLGMAYLMESLEISMGLGAFMAGVLLADSEYRHALETDIEPFKGLLLGLFFMSVGMSINFDSVVQHPIQVAALLVFLLGIKIFVHRLLAFLFKLPKNQALFFSIVISQVGEFAFVLFGLAQSQNLIDQNETGVLLGVVALSMVTTPLFVLFYDKFLHPLINRKEKMEEDKIENDKNPVIIAGFGRFGQIVGRLLYANKFKATVLDYEPDQIEMLRKFGFRIYYGDATRMDLLETAGIADAKILVVAIDDVDENLKLIDLAQQHYPHLKIVARARNVQHYYSLLDRKVAVIEREMFESSLRAGTEVLKLLNFPSYEAVRAAHRFRDHNIAMIHQMHPLRSNEKDLIAQAKQSRVDLEKMFEEERQIRQRADEEWT